MSQQILAKNLKKSSKFVDILAKHFNLTQNFDPKFEIFGNFEISTSFLKLVGHTLHVSDFTSKKLKICQFTSSLRLISTPSFLCKSSASSLNFSHSSLVALIFFLRTSRMLEPCTLAVMIVQDKHRLAITNTRERELTGNFNSAFFRISGSSDGSRTTCLNSSQSTRRAHSLRSAPKRECVNDES